MSIINKKYDFTILFDVQNGNPNGDPDSNNMPRIDPETGLGIVTDVCIKRKIRNYVQMVKGNEHGFDIYIRQGAVLNDLDQKALDEFGIKKEEELKKLSKTEKEDLDINVKNYMCENFYDIRTFGAVMTTFTKNALNSGQLRGPVQLCFAQSVEPIIPRDITLTRVALTTAKDAASKRNTMGGKSIIPYGLYRMDGFVSANLAKTTGFSESDLELFWESLLNMFEDDHSAARGKMSVRKLVIFEHESIYGNAPSWQLFDLVSIKRKASVDVARSYSDYDVSVDTDNVPHNVKCIVRL